MPARGVEYVPPAGRGDVWGPPGAVGLGQFGTGPLDLMRSAL